MSSPYSAAAIAPIIKSPSLWLPRPVEMPMDIHPLPDDIAAYFVYPFTLEPHILSQSTTISTRITEMRESSERLLAERLAKSEATKKDAMNRIAPGYNPNASLIPLQPASSSSSSFAQQQHQSQPTRTLVTSQSSGMSGEGQGGVSGGNEAQPQQVQSAEDMFRSLNI